jgi:PEP-CTERM motif
MRRFGGLGVRLVVAAALALLPTAAAAVVQVALAPTDPFAVDLTARARYGRNNFESVVLNENVAIGATQRNPAGNPVWQLGQAYNFQFNWVVATGTLSWAIDFDRNGLFSTAETSSFVKTSRIGYSYEYISLSLTSATQGNGNHSNAIDVTNLMINGVSFSNLTAANGAASTTWFEPLANTFRDISISGSITFRNTGGNGAFAEERPRLNIDLVNPEPVPEPAAWGMLVAGFGFVGAVQRRRNRSVTS